MLLLTGVAPVEPIAYASIPRFFFSLSTSFLFLLLVIFLQNRLFKSPKKNLYLLSQIEILSFLIIYYFVFNAGSILPYSSPIFNSQFLSSLLPILLYLAATGFYYFSSYGAATGAYRYAVRQIKTLIPFALPFLIFTLLADIARLFGIDPFANSLISILLLTLSILFLAVCFPPIICKLWECKPLTDSEIRNRLEMVCKKANFSHAGLKNWNLFEFSPTAAIIGVIARFRYILFTPSLLKNLSPEALEAVLAHEIGHSKHKHLLFFPFVLFGMVLFTSFTLEGILHIFPVAPPAFVFLLLAILIAFYFRFILGFFSRLFERQADLYGMQLGIPLPAMIEALDTIGNLTGNSHRLPNWHHFSIHERMQFLKEVEKNPSLAARYNRYVKRVQIFFILLLCIASLLLF